MLGDFIYSGREPDDFQSGPGVSPDREGYTYEGPQKVEKALKRFLLLATVFISGGILWIFIISPSTVPAKIDVRSFPGLDRAEALQIAGISSGATYIAINAADAEMRLSRHFMVESARVTKRFPDRLSIFLEPRRAVAVTLAQINGRTLPAYLDRHGVIVRIGSGAGEMPLSSLPVVSGVFDNNQQPRLGTRLSASVVPLFSRIGTITDEDPNIWQAISEISIARKSNDLFDLVLYPMQGSIRLRMGGDITKESIYYALLMYDVCRQLVETPDEIDVRSGIGVFKAQEARFGI
jgi:cell division protein FtsQ